MQVTDQTPAEQVFPPADVREAIVAQWHSRAKVQGLGKPTSAKYLNARAEFFAGAMTALGAMGYQPPAYWVIAIFTGREI